MRRRFGVKYFSKDDAEHLIKTLKKNYVVSKDWTGKKYCGFNINWNYKKEYVDISIPKYIQKRLMRYKHPIPSKKEYTPFRYNQPVYGMKKQIIEQEKLLPTLPEKEIAKIQLKIGTCLYYARGFDPTILVALNALATDQAKTTETTQKDIIKLFNYLATNPTATI